MTAPLLTIIIVSWNSWPKLKNCLASIYAGWLPAVEIIVIDNASADRTVEQVRETFPRVKVQQNQANLGHTRAVNLGFSLSHGAYILVLDDDTELAPDCIRLLLGFLEAHAEVAMVAPRTFNSDGTVQESARNFPGIWSGVFGRQSLLTRVWPGNPFSRKYLVRDFLHAKAPFPVEQIGGACMFFRRTLLERIGPWDERYLGYWVDTDWCRSVHKQGLPIYCIPDAHLTHHEENARQKRKTVRRIWMFHRGAYQYYTKWHCRGRWDPRSIFAGLMLTTRALLQIVLNETMHRRAPARESASEIERTTGSERAPGVPSPGGKLPT